MGSVLFCHATPRDETSYDLEQAAARIRETAYPDADEFAARSVLNPRSEAEMLQLFARAELKL